MYLRPEHPLTLLISILESRAFTSFLSLVFSLKLPTHIPWTWFHSLFQCVLHIATTISFSQMEIYLCLFLFKNTLMVRSCQEGIFQLLQESYVFHVLISIFLNIFSFYQLPRWTLVSPKEILNFSYMPKYFFFNLSLWRYCSLCSECPFFQTTYFMIYWMAFLGLSVRIIYWLWDVHSTLSMPLLYSPHWVLIGGVYHCL